ncbi:MAG: hypothetical protein JWO85_268 [Candidatus Eremiobacteraeota bacterium]|nr:hypothetical protein [Candidatus Eremiobacteraeota bacterium]
MRLTRRPWANAFTLLFLLDGVADLTGLATGNEGWRFVTKPALMPLLLLSTLLRLPLPNAAGMLLIFALFYSAAGDVELLLPGDPSFTSGTIWFAFAQIAYIFAFAKMAPGVGLVQRRPWLALPYVAAWLAGVAVVWPHLGALRAVVVPYSALVTLMAVAALNLFGRIDRRDALLVAAGAVLFLFSDTNLGLSRFVPSLAPPFAPFVVMLAYIVAQALIAAGLVRAQQKTARIP